MNQRVFRSTFHLSTAGNKWLLLVLLAFIFHTSLPAQSKKEKLQKQYKSLISEIANIEKTIKATADKKKASLHQVQSLSEKIQTRSSVIDNLNRLLLITENEISTTEEQITTLEEDISKLKDEYAKMMVQSYKNLNFRSDLMFILSAQTFNQAWQRLKYIQKFSEYRKQQANTIEKSITQKEEKLLALEDSKLEKKKLISEQKLQMSLMESEIGEKKQLAAKLADDEESLKKKIKDKNALAKQLDDQIQSIILKEIQLAKERAAQKKKAGDLSKTPDYDPISKDFVKNKGQLPWPVEKGHVIAHFGRYPHPQVANVYVNNNGVDIKTSTKSTVRAIFGGSVVSVFYLPGKENSIIVKHGDYFTVYSNIVNTRVKSGDIITTKQVLGEVYTDPKENLSMVHFEVWKGSQKLNPELWLGKSL